MALRSSQPGVDCSSLGCMCSPTFLCRLSRVTGDAQQAQVGEAMIVARNDVVYVSTGCPTEHAQSMIALVHFLPEIGPVGW